MRHRKCFWRRRERDAIAASSAILSSCASPRCSYLKVQDQNGGDGHVIMVARRKSACTAKCFEHASNGNEISPSTHRIISSGSRNAISTLWQNRGLVTLRHSGSLKHVTSRRVHAPSWRRRHAYARSSAAAFPAAKSPPARHHEKSSNHQ